MNANKNKVNITKKSFSVFGQKLRTYRCQIKLIKHYNLKFFLSLGHAVLLVVFTLVLQYVTISRTDEIKFLKSASIFKHNILGIDPKPVGDSVVFLNVSKDVMTVDDPDSLLYTRTDSLEGARVVIKDRRKLAAFFGEINQYVGEYKYIICDILFDYPSPDDSLLKAKIESTKNLITSSIYKNGSVVEPIFNVKNGCVNYTSAKTTLISNKGSLFLKLPLVYFDSVKSLPVMMYEELTGNSITEKHGLTYCNNRLAFNTVIPELYYRPVDMRTSGVHQNTFYLGDLVTTSPSTFFNDYLRGKYIVIGDFDNDRHSTYMGVMPGTLLLFNTYLSLRNKQPLISIMWLLILFVAYTIVSYFMFIHPERKFKNLQSEIKFRFFKSVIVKYVSFIGIMILIDLVSYFFYSTFVSIFYIATYLTFLEICIGKYDPVRKKIVMYLRKLKLLKPVLFFGALLISIQATTQIYSVSAVIGNVYYNKGLLKKGDKLNNPQYLTADKPSAKVRLLSPATGSILISFINSKPVTAENAATHSELYQLTVQNYISQWRSLSGTLTTRGDFDWFLFFVDSVKGKMAIFENEKIPLTTNKVVMDSTVKFFAVIYDDYDSVTKKIPIAKDSLFLAKNIFPENKPFKWRLKVSYVSENATHISIITDSVVTSWYISQTDLDNLIKDFITSWDENYSSAEEAKIGFYTFMAVNYGVFYNSYLNNLLDTELSTK